MTRLELQTLVWGWLDDPLGGYFSAAQVQTWLNLGQQKVQKKLIQSGEFWWTIFVQSSTTANIPSYELPTDFLKLHKMEIITSGTYPNEQKVRLNPVTPVQQDFYPNGAGVPGAYWLRKNAIQLMLPPDQAYTMQLLYSYQIPDLTTDTQSPDMPDRYQEGIAIEATLIGLLKDQRSPSDFLMTKQKEFNEDLAKDAQERNVDEPRYVIETDCEAGFSF